MNKMKTRILLSLFLFAFLQSQAQKNDSLFKKTNNAFYLELVGNAPFVSANYERKIYGNTIYSIYARIGFGVDVVDFRQSNLFVPTLPLEISSSFGSSKHHLEIGVGVTPFYSKVVMWSLSYDYGTN